MVNIASVAGLAGLRNGAAYNASKGGVKLLTMNMALDFAEQGIRVNCVAPGPAPTKFGAVFREGLPPLTPEEEKQGMERMAKFMPLGRIGTAEDIANATAFLASDTTSFVTGQVFHVSGGSVM